MPTEFDTLHVFAAGAAPEPASRAANWVVEKGLPPAYGARELRRAIQREIETPLSRVMIGSAIDPGGLVRVRIEGEQLAIDREG